MEFYYLLTAFATFLTIGHREFRDRVPVGESVEWVRELNWKFNPYTRYKSRKRIKELQERLEDL